MKSGGTKRRLLIALCLFAALTFCALGFWQVERRAWKLDLIARVNARVHAAPVPIPSANQWSSFDQRRWEYRRVRIRGRFLHDRETFVDALTELGPGSWVVTPLDTGHGIVLVNRGFVPPERRTAFARQKAQHSGEVTVTGLLRANEPEGRVLRPNQPAADRWFSRDVAAIARARGLSGAAPFFVDADGAPNPGGVPIGGLTVIRFRNTHLIYALTWFGLAALSIAGLVLLLKPAQRPD